MCSSDLGFFVDEDSTENKLDPVFDKETLEYKVKVPFSVEQVFVVAETTNRFAQIKYSPELIDKIDDGGFLQGIFGREKAKQWTIEIPRPDEGDKELVQEITVEAEAYDADDPVDAYSKTTKVVIQRDEPSTDATLGNLEIFDKDDMEVEYTPAFDTKIKEYEVNIPNTTEHLKVT